MTILTAVIAEPTVPQSPAQAVLEHTARLIRTFSIEWHGEVPQQIHDGSLDEDGMPGFHPDFIAYIDRPCYVRTCHKPNCDHGLRALRPDSRVRMTRAYRRLRAEAPREFDALILVTKHGLTLEEVAIQLTERSVRLGHADRYTRDGVLILVISAAHKVEQWC